MEHESYPTDVIAAPTAARTGQSFFLHVLQRKNRGISQSIFNRGGKHTAIPRRRHDVNLLRRSRKQERFFTDQKQGQENSRLYRTRDGFFFLESAEIRYRCVEISDMRRDEGAFDVPDNNA